LERHALRAWTARWFRVVGGGAVAVRQAARIGTRRWQHPAESINAVATALSRISGNVVSMEVGQDTLERQPHHEEPHCYP
jgi:hypothetical protein